MQANSGLRAFILLNQSHNLVLLKQACFFYLGPYLNIPCGHVFFLEFLSKSRINMCVKSDFYSFRELPSYEVAFPKAFCLLAI